MDFKDIIKRHLDAMAQDDPSFATTYAKGNKNIDECCKYIIQEVCKMKRDGNCTVLEDDEVYGMAVHYYEEDSIKVEKNDPAPAASVCSTSYPKAVQKPAVRKAEEHMKKPKEDWPSLFDGML